MINVRIQPMYIPGGNPETMNEPVATWRWPGLIGGVMTTDDRSVTPARSKTYQMVRTDSTMSVNPYRGAVAWWSDRATYTTTTAATLRGMVAGVYLNALTKGNLTMIQTKGNMTAVKIVDAPTAQPTTAGLFVIPSGTASKADVLAAGTAPSYPILGRSASALNLADSTCTVDLDVPEVL